MAGRPKRRAKKWREHLKTLSPTEQARILKRQERAKHTPEQRAEMRAKDTARCYDWALIEPRVRKQPDGCWIWMGCMSLSNSGKLRPIIRAGQYGKAYADLVVYFLTHGEPPPRRCSVEPSCGNLRCVAAGHMVTINEPIRLARRRGVYGQNLGQRHIDGNAGREASTTGRRSAAR